MGMIRLETGQIAYDPRGVVNAEPKLLAGRLSSLDGLRVGVLDNTKWNGGKLLRKTVSLMESRYRFKALHSYKKESFSKKASPELLEQIARENDAVLTAIGD